MVFLAADISLLPRAERRSVDILGTKYKHNYESAEKIKTLFPFKRP